MNLALDLDDTLAGFADAFVAFCNAQYGTTFRKESFTHPDPLKTWGISYAEMSARWSAFDRIYAQSSISPLLGAQAMVARFARKHSLHLVTHRRAEFKNNTLRWLDQHFERMFSHVHFCGRRDGLPARQKSTVCKTIDAHIILEDHPHVARECAENGIHVYLFNQPWNRSHDFPPLAGGVVRVKDWHDPILETLLS
jgi:uncharacterized HAD superfamily protein